MSPRPQTILFVFCHPDDEVLWAGGLLCALPSLANTRAMVVILSGGGSSRRTEFEQVRQAAAYHAGVLLGGDLLPSTEPLPPIGTALEQGIQLLGIDPGDVDALITHSPYGDEHANRHHRQAYRELRAWTRRHSVPFGYASCLPLPFFYHRPLLRNLRRQGPIQVLNLSRCTPVYSRVRRTLDPLFRRYLDCPRYYLQFQIDAAAKRALLDGYNSVDVPAHVSGYAMATSSVEALYLFDDRALAPFAAAIESMAIPGVGDLFALSDTRLRLRSLKRRVLQRLGLRSGAV
ncbi:MAG TPA: hypothetical protein VK009_01270 [Chloroflexota bacterium]|nr:hypothetical protein [Chloroflexota bacterium]